METIKVKMFSDYICPWCYLGYGILRSLKREYPLEIEHIGFEIHPETPPAGIPFKEKVQDADKMLEEARIRGKAYGLWFGDVRIVANSRNALLVSEYAKEQGKGEEFSLAVWKANFEQCLNIGEKPVLYTVAGEVGISEREVDLAIDSADYWKIVFNNKVQGNRLRIHTIPTFVVNEEQQIVGAHPEEVFREVFDRIRIGA